MHKAWYFSIVLSSLLLLPSCAKKESSNNSSSVTFQLPSSLGNNQLSGTACFAVSITAPDITPIRPGSCDSSYGVFSGLAPLGGTIELEAKFGQNRTIDIFYVISDEGCKKFDPNLGLGQVFGTNRVYRISQTKNINFDQPEVIVNAQIAWPEAKNSLATLFNLPTNCKKGSDPTNLMAIRQARVVQGAAQGVTQNGSRMHVRVLDQKLNMKSPTNFSGRILPVRLGEEP